MQSKTTAKILQNYSSNTKPVLMNPKCLCVALALDYRHFEMARLLLENDADIDAQQIRCNSTFLIGAIYDGEKDKVLWLIENGASLENNYGDTPYKFSLKEKRIDIFKIISYHQGK